MTARKEDALNKQDLPRCAHCGCYSGLDEQGRPNTYCQRHISHAHVPPDHKICSKCLAVQPSSDFRKCRQRIDGLDPYCKTCRKKQYQETKQPLLDRQAVRYQENKHIHIARWKLRHAVLQGELTRPTACQQCGTDAPVDAHHPDYDKPLDVMWLCRSCHQIAHIEAK